MIETNKSLWHPDFDDFWRAIPTNCQVDSRNHLIMGKGLAKQAAERYPRLAQYLGMEAMNGRYFVFVEPEKLIAFPTKYHWREPSSLKLIEEGLQALVSIIQTDKIVSPRLGCGLGGLDWDSDVKPLVLKYFSDNSNFVVVGL